MTLLILVSPRRLGVLNLSSSPPSSFLPEILCLSVMALSGGVVVLPRRPIRVSREQLKKDELIGFRFCRVEHVCDEAFRTNNY